MPTIKIKDNDGNWIALPTVKGDPGPQGPDGVVAIINGTGTLLKTAWPPVDDDNYTSQTVAASGIGTTDFIDVTRVIDISNPETAQAIQAAWNMIEDATIGANSITFHSYGIPDVNIPFAWKKAGEPV